MSTKILGNYDDVNTAKQIEPLYLDFVRAFYEEENRTAARKIAKRLATVMAAHPDFDDSIRAEEIRSLLAELRGDFAEAIRCRESEIRKIFELHSLALNTASREYVLMLYDFSDISDRLDLLASLYADFGETDRALRTLKESKQFCRSHRIRFDGQDLLDRIRRTNRRKTLKLAAGSKP